MTEDDDGVDGDGKRGLAVCPMCKTEDDSAERESGASGWMVCRQCGHPWAYAEN